MDERVEVRTPGRTIARVNLDGPPEGRPCPEPPIGYAWDACGSLLIVRLPLSAAEGARQPSGARGRVTDARGDDLGFYYEGTRGTGASSQLLIGFRRPAAPWADLELEALTFGTGAFGTERAAHGHWILAWTDQLGS